MKKQLLFLIMMLLPMMAWADDSGSCGDNVTYTYEEATHTLTISGTGPMKDFEYNSKFYSAPWDNYKTAIVKAVIEEGVTSIGSYAFEGCRSLTSISIPDGVTSIGSYAFSYCSGLTSITIPNSMKTIEECAFAECSNLSSISIGNELQYIGINAFISTAWYNNQSEGVITLSNWILGYKGQKPSGNIIIEDGTRGIAPHAFIQCNELISIDIPNSVVCLGYGAFLGCSELISAHLGNNITDIGLQTFYDCGKLSNVNIPNGVTYIGPLAFGRCFSLTSISIPPTVKLISNGAFDFCNNLKSVHITDFEAWCMIKFGEYSIDYGYLKESNPLYYAHHLFLNGEELKDVIIPNGITSIDQYAFQFCTELTSVAIPNSVVSIGKGAFRDSENVMIVRSEITEPFNCKNLFSENTYRKGKLYIPAGTKDLYSRFDGWRDFLNIEEENGEAMHIKGKVVNNERSHYSIDGQKMSSSRKGLNIIRMSDGTTKKIILKE